MAYISTELSIFHWCFFYVPHSMLYAARSAVNEPTPARFSVAFCQ